MYLPFAVLSLVPVREAHFLVLTGSPLSEESSPLLSPRQPCLILLSL